MRCHLLVCSIGLLLSLYTVSGCTKYDLVGYVPDASVAVAGETGKPLPPATAGTGATSPRSPDSGPPTQPPKSCTAEAKNFYSQLLSAYFMVEHDCKLTLFDTGFPGFDGGPGQAADPPKGSEAAACEASPYAWWPTPQPPLPTRQLVFCKESCRLFLHRLECLVQTHPCHGLTDDHDAGIDPGDCAPFSW